MEMIEADVSSRYGFVRVLLSLCGLLGVAGLIIGTSFSQQEKNLHSGMLMHRIQRGSLEVIVRGEGILQSEENHEFKSKVRGRNAVLWIIDSGSYVEEGDELVRLDSLFIQEQVDERTKYSNWSQSAADNSAARVARAKIELEQYQNGRYQTELLNIEKAIAMAESALQSAKDQLKHGKQMSASGFLNDTRLDDRQFVVDRTKRNLAYQRTKLHVLKNFTYEEELQRLKGNLTSVEATHNANVERAMADGSRRDRAVEELDYCVIKADRSGLVIHPNAAAWEKAPIAEGTQVWKDQVLLVMPDLDRMQVKIGVHEQSVKRVKVGQKSTVIMGNRTVEGEVSEVASITKPAGWWTGNQVRYDTLISLPIAENQLPGMSAEVEIKVAEYSDVLKIPVAAVVSVGDSNFCWVSSGDGPQRIQIELGDAGESFHVVESGLVEGDEVYMNPFAFETLEEQMEPTSDVTTSTSSPN